MNSVSIKIDNKIILISYKTKVAYYDLLTNKIYKTAKKWSNTTSKHINKFLKDFKNIEIIEVDQNILDNL